MVDEHIWINWKHWEIFRHKVYWRGCQKMSTEIIQQGTDSRMILRLENEIDFLKDEINEQKQNHWDSCFWAKFYFSHI